LTLQVHILLSEFHRIDGTVAARRDHAPRPFGNYTISTQRWHYIRYRDGG
jgi:hypothetical protein